MTNPLGDPNIAEVLARLVRSPRVQTGANVLKGLLPLSSGPLRSSNPSSISGLGPSRGASPRTSQWYDNPGGMFGGIIGSVLSQNGQQMQQAQDPLMALYEQLLSQLQQPVDMPTGIDTEDLMEQVRKAIDPIYDQRSQAAQTRGRESRQEVQDMYRALANDYERLAPQQVAQAAAAQDQVEQLYGQLRSNIEGSYARVSEEQGDLFKQLGIEAALPDVLADQQAAVTEASTAASQNQAQQEQRYMDIGQMDSTYFREGSPVATMAGNEISTDMLSQLNEYLNQLEAERTSGIQSTYMDQLGQAQSQLGQQQQMAQSEAARRQDMLWQMLQSQLQGRNQQQSALTPDVFMSQLPPQVQQQIGTAFTKLQRSPEAVYGKVEDKRNPVPGTFVETTPQWYMAQADEMLRRGEIDASTHQALLMYMQLWFKQGS